MSEHSPVSKGRGALTLFLSLFVVLFSAQVGFAQKKGERPRTVGDILKKIEKKSDQIQVKKTKSNLPKFNKPAAPPTTVNLRAVKPPSSNRLYIPEDANEAELMSVTDQSIDQLYKLTNKYRKSSRRGELWLRLAELYVEKARLVEFQIQNKYDKQMEDFLNKKRKTRPKLVLEPASQYNRKSIQLYEWFIRDFPKDPKVDQALFFLGYNHFELNEVKKGEKYYIRLTKEFPKSTYVVESNFALGEYYFDNEKWKEAKPHYLKVAKAKRHRLYSFALYKLAWVNYKMQNTKVALKYLEEVILEGRRGKTKESSSGVSQIRLAGEAIKDLIVFYAEAGDYRKARSYFEEVIGQKSAQAQLGRLATYYMDTGNRAAAAFMFKDLISEDPSGPKSFDYQQNIVRMLQSGGGSKEFLAELSAWIELYGPGSPWQAANSRDKELIATANQSIESTLRNYVLQQHQTAQNSRAKSSQQKARDGYELYLKTFNSGSHLAEMHFFYGELLFDIEDYQRAAAQYNWVLEKAPNTEYAEKAVLNSLLALEKRLPTSEQIKKGIGDRKDPVDFPGSVVDFEVAAKRYFDKVPKGENTVAIKYRLAALHYYFNHYDDALLGFREIIQRYPKTEYAEYSANLMLDIYNLKGDYVGLQAAAEEILKVPNLAKSSVGAQIKDIKVQTDFKLAKDFEDKKDFGRSANAYLSFANNNRSNPLAFTALYNSAINFERAGDLVQAIGLYQTVASSKTKGGADLKDNAEKFLPPLYEKTGQYEKAAKSFEAYASSHPKDKIAEEYFYNAAILYDGLNSYQSAIRNYERYFKLSKKTDRHETLFLLGEMHERIKSYDKAISYYNQYLGSGTKNAAGVVEAAFNIAKIHERRGKKKYAEEWFGKTVATQRNLARKGQVVGVSFAAEAKFKLVRGGYDDLVRIKIPAGKAQAAAVKNKLAALNKLKEDLKAVIVYDDAFQLVAALNLQGKALFHMYESLMNAPMPKGMTKEETAAYRSGVEQQLAGPFKTQSLEVLDLAVKRGHELQGYGPDLIEASKALAVLRGDRAKDIDPRIKTTTLPDTLGL